MAGKKEKLTLTACTVDDGMVRVGSNRFEVMLNPAEFSHGHSISYSNTSTGGAGERPFGRSGVETKFNNYDSETLDFSLVIDGTGVTATQDTKRRSVKDQIDAIKDIAYRFEGENHQPYVVQLLWQSLLFYGRLTKLDVEYTLFKPSGEPLRAKVKLSFCGYTSNQEESLKAHRRSPDLTHVVEVQEGDTLPLLCYRIYRNSSYYMEVARFNDLLNFRQLKPGDRLRFPPLR